LWTPHRQPFKKKVNRSPNSLSYSDPESDLIRASDLEHRVLDYTEDSKVEKAGDGRLAPFLMGLTIKAGSGSSVKRTTGVYKNWLTLHPNPSALSDTQLNHEFDYLLNAHQQFNPGAYAPYDRELFIEARRGFQSWMKRNPGFTPPPYFQKQSQRLKRPIPD